MMMRSKDTVIKLKVEDIENLVYVLGIEYSFKVVNGKLYGTHYLSNKILTREQIADKILTDLQKASVEGYF